MSGAGGPPGSHLGADPLPKPLPNPPRPSHASLLTRLNSKATGARRARPSFGTKRSWVQIPPPRQRKHQFRGLIRESGRAPEWFVGALWRNPGEGSEERALPVRIDPGPAAGMDFDRVILTVRRRDPPFLAHQPGLPRLPTPSTVA
ncbi:hypothetical protein GCM10028832_02590 [Streptomyces sparsus]